MTLSLGSNIQSLTAVRRVAESTERLSRVYSRLSSGLRINRASDDAAGLSIASSLQKDARVYSQALRNGNDAISALTISHGTAQQLTGVLIRIRELAIQSANGTFSLEQRNSLDEEGASLTDEFNRLVASSSFNGLNILDGSLGDIGVQLGFGENGSILVGFGSGLSRKLGNGFATGTTVTGSNTTYTASDRQALADVNGDGKLDMLSGVNGSVEVALGNGDGSFQAPTTLSTGQTTRSVIVGDFTGDGIIDIVGGSTAGGVLFSGTGGGAFGSGTAFAAGVDLSGLVRAADLNNDGIFDIVADPTSGNNITVLLATGGGSFGSAQTLTTSAAVVDARIADFNSDGKLDIATSNTSIHIFLGNGNGSFQSAITTSTGGISVTSIDVGDFNYDGRMDIVGASGPTSTIRVFNGNGDGTFGAYNSYSATLVSSITVGDVDADGVLDIVGVRGSANLYFLKGKNDGTFNSTITTSIGSTATAAVLLGDLNGDGVLDAVTHASGSALSQVMLSNTFNGTTLQRMNLNTRQMALDALSVIDSAMARVTKEIGNIGMAQSRLLAAMNTLSAARENSLLAAGRIMDADIAGESAHLIKEQIVQQAGASVLSQANQAPALALQLLRA